MNISKHPLIKQAYELCLEIEKIPFHPTPEGNMQQTKCSSLASDLGREIERILDTINTGTGEGFQFELWLARDKRDTSGQGYLFQSQPLKSDEYGFLNQRDDDEDFMIVNNCGLLPGQCVRVKLVNPSPLGQRRR